MMPYTTKANPEKTSKAYGKELSISPKKSYELCNAIRGMKVEKAKEYLQNVIALKQLVPFRRYNDEVAHKKGKRYGAGRHPQKVAKEILRVIENAQENAEFKGLDSENMKILHIASHRGRIIKGYMPRAQGRSTKWDEQTTNIEVILEEMETEE